MITRAAAARGVTGLSRATVDMVKSVVRSIADATAADVALAADPDAVAQKFVKPIGDALGMLGTTWRWKPTIRAPTRCW